MSAALPVSFVKYGLQILTLARHDAISPSTLVPKAPHEQGPEETDAPHDHEDDAHRVEVETAGSHAHGEVEDRSNGNEEQAHADTHVRSTSRSGDHRVEDLPTPHSSDAGGVPATRVPENEGASRVSDSSYSAAGSGDSSSN